MTRQFRQSFPRSVATSIFTTGLDFGLLTALVELAHVNYVLATFLGTVLGASSNFLINRYWAFAATGGRAHHQAMRSLVVQIGSSTLHTTGVWALTRFGGLHYTIAKAVIAIATYLGWNYPMNHYYVFSRSSSSDRPSALTPSLRATIAAPIIRTDAPR